LRKSKPATTISKQMRNEIQITRNKIKARRNKIKIHFPAAD
jgi:hypothetical protein